MSNRINLDNEPLNEKVKLILEDEPEIKKWNEDLWLKSLILLPSLMFVIGLFIINKPKNISEIIFVLIYPLILILIGVLILFIMTRNLK